MKPETRDELIQRGRAELRGTWPEGCLQRAFVEGASWLEFHKTGFTMWQSDRRLAEIEAVKMYGEPTNLPRWKVTLEQETDGRWIGEIESVPGALAYGETKEEAAIKAAEIARASLESEPEMKLCLITLLLLLSGCAARPPHARIVQAPTTLCSAQKEKPSAQHPCLSEEFWQCDGGACYLTRSWEPSQLTVAGCALHYLVTFGKVPLECKRRPRAGD